MTQRSELAPEDTAARVALWRALHVEVDVSAATLTRRYFADRSDGPRPPLDAEEFLVART
ncbi:MAG TPA: hypothetical protein VFS52_04000 [Steroidobacteraceae bacterium]|jgi:hypothetical protein|nr:hypothetical protein [Steroidobacteraceae bacterium]